jgi:hypothetical protein
VLLGLALTSVPASAQVAGRIKNAVKESVDRRKSEAEDRLVMESGRAADSLVALGLNPVDSLLGTATAGVQAAVTFVAAGVRGDRAGGERARMAKALQAGRVDLSGVFLARSAEPSEDGAAALEMLAGLVAERGEPVLIEAFAAPDEDRDLAPRRVRMVRTLLLAHGLDASQMLAVADAKPDPDASHGAVVQVRVRPLRAPAAGPGTR